MLGKQEAVPPPGAYYDDNKFSSFKIKQKPIEFQCFDSTAERLKEPSNAFQLGPGEYQVNHIDDFLKKGNKFGFERRIL
jgi:hypothetical protein